MRVPDKIKVIYLRKAVRETVLAYSQECKEYKEKTQALQSLTVQEQAGQRLKSVLRPWAPRLAHYLDEAGLESLIGRALENRANWGSLLAQP